MTHRPSKDESLIVIIIQSELFYCNIKPFRISPIFIIVNCDKDLRHQDKEATAVFRNGRR